MNRCLGVVVGLGLALVVGCVVGCGDDHEHEHEGEATGAVCSTGSALTYENFGQPFMEDYCTRCHSSERTGADRNNAPLDHDFDTLLGILGHAEHIDEHAAAGPNATNTIMPPSGAAPTVEERRQLGEWLACEIEHFGDIDAGHDDAGH